MDVRLGSHSGLKSDIATCPKSAQYLKSPRSFDHFVGELLKLQRHIEAECLCCLEIYHQLEFGRLLDRQISGRGPAQDFIDVNRGPPVETVQISSITHQQTPLPE